MESKQTDPLQDLFSDIKKIIDFMEVKDLARAMKYETSEIRNDAEMWMNALLEMDTYLTYKIFWDMSMFQEIVSNVRLRDIQYWMENPYNVPLNFRDNLLRRGRETFLRLYEEKNTYYRMLNGLPEYGTNKTEFIYLSEPMRNQLHAPKDIPVHMLSPLIQNSYISTDEYQSVLQNNPDKEYLKYLGIYKIDIYTARKAKDFDIIRYSNNRSDINPNLINQFGTLYADYREYVMTTLYNKQFESLYGNYRTFMGMLITSFVLLQISNKAVEAINDKNFLDDSVLHILLSMYDIPKTLLMTNEVRRSLVINMLKLVREKGTDDVYYDLIKILGYQDIIVSKLMLMKGQRFDSSNNYSTQLPPPNDHTKLEVDPYFIQVDLEDENPYDTITSGKAPIHSYHSIIDPDPTWWDLPDTQDLLKNTNYTVADSKYIMVEAVIHQIKYLFESIYFTRMILDNKTYTDKFLITIPEIFGTEPVSIYDLMVFIISAACMNNELSGKIVTEESKIIATAGFNFDMDLDSFVEFINTTRYVDKERVMGFMENLTMKNKSDINRLFNDVIYPMREWLESKISMSENRMEYLEYENIYRALYTYDATRNSFLQDFITPIENVRIKHGLTQEEMNAYRHFYPRTLTGETITVESYPTSRYKTPFIAHNNEIDWWIHVIIETPQGEDDRGYVYFHDILNSTDLRTLTNPDGTRVFMDYEDTGTGWEINRKAVEKAAELIEQLDEKDLYNAFFQVNTPVLNIGGFQFFEGEKLPPIVRSGIYKQILKDKLMMDMQGLAVQPTTYQEYLYRKNLKLYDLLTQGDRFHLDKEAWLNDVMRIILAMETELDLHMKYFEQSIVGSELFFKPLITLIKHFKSTFVNFAKTGLRYIMGDKIDTGGNSNMFKLFDDVKFVIHFLILAQRGDESQFGLYDTEHMAKFGIVMKDRSEILHMTSEGFDVNLRTERMGSIHMVDEMKFFLNGEDKDPSGQPSSWYSGEPGTGRWEQEEEYTMRTELGTEKIKNLPVDLEGWKDFVESYNHDK